MRLDTEATLQAEFYHACRNHGLPCVLELETPAGRLDAVILTEDRLAITDIVEVKRVAIEAYNGNTPQIQRYKKLGCPVHHLHSGIGPHALAIHIWNQRGTPVTLKHIASLSHMKKERKQARATRRLERLRENLSIR